MATSYTALYYSALLLLLSSHVLVSPVQAHMEIESPPPLRSRFNTQYDWSTFDYSMTNPLSPDGSNFACKGYQGDVPSVSHAVDTITAGQPYTVKLAPGVTHSGGSCQFSLSYDGGKSFGVVHSVIGGCPIALEYTFTVPAGVPAGKNVLLAWTWFNKVGNREMYMNCAAIDVKSSSTSSIKLPRIFQANVFGAGKCNTVEGDEVVFPNPGSSVQYGGKWAGQAPPASAMQISNCDANTVSGQSSWVTLSSDGSPGDGGVTTKPTSTSSAYAPPASTYTKVTVSNIVSKSTSITRATTTKVAKAAKTNRASTTKVSSTPGVSVSIVKPSSSSPSPPPTAGQTGGCTDGSLRCSTDGKSFSVCGSGVWVSMGSVAPGTMCEDGQIVLARVAVDPTPSGTTVKCTPNTLKCGTDGQSFSVCAETGDRYVFMGAVAPGTRCANGTIQLARTRRIARKLKAKTKSREEKRASVDKKRMGQRHARRANGHSH